MSTIPEEERFAKNTIILAQAIHESVQRLYNQGYNTVHPNLVAMAISLISNFDKHYLIQGFIESSYQVCWDGIKRRDEKFFVENASDIFKYLPMDKVNLFKDLFLTRNPTTGESVVSQTLKDQLWDLLDSLIRISIKYIHKGRGPYSQQTSDGLMHYYSHDYFEEVDLSYHADVWNIQLDFPLRI